MTNIIGDEQYLNITQHVATIKHMYVINNFDNLLCYYVSCFGDIGTLEIDNYVTRYTLLNSDRLWLKYCH